MNYLRGTDKVRFWLEERGSRLVEEVALELRFESEIRAETLNVQRQKSRDGVGEGVCVCCKFLTTVQFLF